MTVNGEPRIISLDWQSCNCHTNACNFLGLDCMVSAHVMILSPKFLEVMTPSQNVEPVFRQAEKACSIGSSIFVIRLLTLNLP
jgi:hypothetical protein